VFEGTIEFFLNPDWNKDPGCHTCEDAKDHTIFRIFNGDGFVLGAFMTGYGLRIYLHNGITHTFLTDNSSVRLIAGQNHHVAVVWDFLGKYSSNAILVYIDNVLSSSFPAEAVDYSAMTTNPDATLLLGGYAWGGVTERRISSVDGAVENIKMFNFAKTDFKQSIENQGLENLRTADDLIEVSVDGVSYYGSNDRGNGLPLLKRNIGPGQSFDVYIKRKENETGLADNGQDRTSYIEVLRAVAEVIPPEPEPVGPVVVMGEGNAYGQTSSGVPVTTFNVDTNLLDIWLGGGGPYDIAAGDVIYFLFVLSADVTVTPPDPFGTLGWVNDRVFQVSSNLWAASLMKIFQPGDTLDNIPFTFSGSAESMVMLTHLRGISTAGNTVHGSQLVTYTGQTSHQAPSSTLYGTPGEQKAMSILIHEGSFTTFSDPNVTDLYDNSYSGGVTMYTRPVLKTFPEGNTTPVTFTTLDPVDSAVLTFPFEPG
jgi:hypothetical protein